MHAPGAFHSAPCFYSLSLTSSFCPTHYYRRSFLIPLPHSFFLFLLAHFVQDHEASPPQSPIIDQCISPPVLASYSLFSYPLITVSGPNFFLFPVSLNFPLFFPSFPYPPPWSIIPLSVHQLSTFSFLPYRVPLRSFVSPSSHNCSVTPPPFPLPLFSFLFPWPLPHPLSPPQPNKL